VVLNWGNRPVLNEEILHYSAEFKAEAVALHVNLDKTADLTKETSSVQAASIKRC
jgi:hypothetical protein